MAWIAQQDCELLRTWISKSKNCLLTSLHDGRILWCNEAFEEFIGYSQYELTIGHNGKGISWPQITLQDGSFEADTMMVEELVAGRRQSYTVRKQYIPKNEKPTWVELNVTRWPFEGDIACFLVEVTPLKNGTAAAAQIASEQMSQVLHKLEDFKKETVTVLNAQAEKFEAATGPKTEVEKAILSLTRLGVANPKLALAAFMAFLLLLGGSNAVSFINGMRQLMGIPVQAIEVKKE